MEDLKCKFFGLINKQVNKYIINNVIINVIFFFFYYALGYVVILFL